jgi:hypothetical protein
MKLIPIDEYVDAIPPNILIITQILSTKYSNFEINLFLFLKL